MDKNKTINTAILFISVLIIILHIFFWFSSPGFLSSEGEILSKGIWDISLNGILSHFITQIPAGLLGEYTLRILSLISLFLIFMLMKKITNIVYLFSFYAVILSIPQFNIYLKVFSVFHIFILFYYLYNTVNNEKIKAIILMISPLVSPFFIFLFVENIRKTTVKVSIFMSSILLLIFYRSFDPMNIIRRTSGLYEAIPLALLFVLLTLSEKKYLEFAKIILFIIFVSLFRFEMIPFFSYGIVLFYLLPKLNSKLLRYLFPALAVFNMLSGFFLNSNVQFQFYYKNGAFIKHPYNHILFSDIKHLITYQGDAIVSEQLRFMKKKNWGIMEDVISTGTINKYEYLFFDNFLFEKMQHDRRIFEPFANFKEEKRLDNVRVFRNTNYFLKEFADYINDRLMDGLIIADNSIVNLINGRAVGMNELFFDRERIRFLDQAKFLFIADFLLEDTKYGTINDFIKDRLEAESWVPLLKKNGFTLYQHPLRR